MKVEIEWMDPIDLKGKNHNSGGYDEEFLKNIEPVPGVYVFTRKYGQKFTPIYIGKSKDLRRRLKIQMNNLKLMEQLRNGHPKNSNSLSAINGKRVLFVGYSRTASAANKDKAIELAEKGLIEFAMSNGFPIVNIHGTIVKYHEIIASGAGETKGFMPDRILVRIR